MVVGNIDSVHRLFNSLKRDEAIGFKIAGEIRPLLPGGNAGERLYSFGDFISDHVVPPC